MYPSSIDGRRLRLAGCELSLALLAWREGHKGRQGKMQDIGSEHLAPLAPAVRFSLAVASRK